MAHSEIFYIIAYGKCEVRYTKSLYSVCTTIMLFIKQETLRRGGGVVVGGISLNKIGRGPLGHATNQPR